jgi:hypothetical protein
MHMIIDDDILKRLLRINDGLFRICQSLNDMARYRYHRGSAVDELTHLLVEAETENASESMKNKP